MTTEVINIQIREDGSRTVSRNIAGIGDAADKSGTQVNHLKGILSTLVTGAAVVALGKMVDQYTTLQNQLRVVTSDTANLARVTKELNAVANQTRSDVVATTELYARLANATKDLGVGQQDLIDFTKSLNQAIVLSGAGAAEAAAGIRQLSQGMASGTLRGDELNSVLENLPIVADVIAKQLGVTRGQLRQLGAEGKVTAKDILDAFRAAKDDLEKGFATTVPTLGQAFQVLKNNVLTFFGELDQRYQISAKFSQLLLDIANNLDKIIPLLTAVGIAVATAFVPSLVAQFAGQIKILWSLLAANPFVALAGAVAGAVAYLTIFRDEITLGIDETTTLGDVFRAVWEEVQPMLQVAADAIAQFFSWLTQSSAGTFGQLLNDIVGYEHQSEATWLKIVRVVVKVFDMIGGVVRGTMAGIASVISGVIAAGINSFEQLGNAAKAALEGDWEGVAKAAALSKAGAEMGLNIGENFSKAFKEQVLSQDANGLESVLDNIIKRAQEIGKARAAAAQGPAQGALNPGGTPKPIVDPNAAKEAEKALKKLTAQFERLQDQLDPIGAAQREYAEGQEIINKAVKAGLLDASKQADYLERLKELYRDAIDPIGALNRELDRQREMLKLSSEQAQIEEEVFRRTLELKRAGVTVTKEFTDSLRAELTVQQELARIAQARDDLERNSTARKQRDIDDRTAALGQLEGAGKLTQGDTFNAANEIMGGRLSGTSDAIAAQLEQQQFYYDNLKKLRDQDLISEQTYQEARIQLWAQTQSIQLQQANDFFGNLAGLAKSENKRIAQIGKAAAITQTIIKTYESATSAYASLAGIPVVGPALGAAAAAGAIAAGMANVAAIRSQGTEGFRTGGEMTVGGYGGSDSQLVAFRATPGEKVSVNTPAQARAIENSDQQAPPAMPEITVLNTLDPQMMLSALNTSDGKMVLVNMIQDDPTAFKRALGN